MNSKEFSLEIEKIVQEKKGISYMDAILKYCEENELDPGTVAPMLTKACLLYTSPSPRDKRQSRMPSSA